MTGLYRILGKLMPPFALVYGILMLVGQLYALNAASELSSGVELSALVLGSALLGVASKVALLLAAGAVFQIAADRQDEKRMTAATDDVV